MNFNNNNSNNNHHLALDQVQGIQEGYYLDTPGNAETARLLAKIDTLRYNQEKQSLLVTSAVLGEGKSTVSSQIALASSRNRGKPTLLIDFDLRRPKIHQIFGLRKEPGVSEVLTRQLSFTNCVKNTFVDNLKIMTSGSLDNSPLEVFNAERAKRFFEEALHYFDFIVVDSPPVIPVSDPLILGRVVDHIVLVVRAGQTPRKVVKRAVDLLNGVELVIAGIILNNVNDVLPSCYDYKYYGYHYYNYHNQELQSTLE